MVTQTLMPVSSTKRLSKKSEMTSICKTESYTYIAVHHPSPDIISMVLNADERKHTLSLLKKKLFKE